MRKPIGKIHNPSLARRVRRKLAIRKKVIGTAQKPRVCMKRTNKHIVAQVVDDSAGRVLFSVQTYGKNGVKGGANNRAGAKLVGLKLVEKLKEVKVDSIVFDRAGHQYGGVIAVFAEAVREKGIHF